MSVSSVTSRSTCISGSRCAIVFHSCYTWLYTECKYGGPLGRPGSSCAKARLVRIVSKTKHPKTKTEARSTQISKTKHPKLENEAPKSRKRSTQNSKTKTPKSRKRSTQKLDTGLSFISTRPMLIQQESSTITSRMQFKSTQVVSALPPLRGRPGGRPCFGRDQKTENAQTISRMLLYCQ